jgi:hypothetical protein
VAVEGETISLVNYEEADELVTSPTIIGALPSDRFTRTARLRSEDLAWLEQRRPGT